MKVSKYLDTKLVQELPGVTVRDIITKEEALHFVMRLFEVESGSATAPADYIHLSSYIPNPAVYDYTSQLKRIERKAEGRRALEIYNGNSVLLGKRE